MQWALTHHQQNSGEIIYVHVTPRTYCVRQNINVNCDGILLRHGKSVLGAMPWHACHLVISVTVKVSDSEWQLQWQWQTRTQDRTKQNKTTQTRHQQSKIKAKRIWNLTCLVLSCDCLILWFSCLVTLCLVLSCDCLVIVLWLSCDCLVIVLDLFNFSCSNLGTLMRLFRGGQTSKQTRRKMKQEPANRINGMYIYIRHLSYYLCDGMRTMYVLASTC